MDKFAHSNNGEGKQVCAGFLAGGCHRIREPFPLGALLEVARGLGDVLTPGSLSAVAALRPLLPELAERVPPPLPPLGDRQAETAPNVPRLVALLGAAAARGTPISPAPFRVALHALCR